ncbi:hypothetical protein OS493_032187 [Desmophyllum pertusum]|uniref:Uncharacterized protein n=1 Tax=Desmophyllum pertusum TaxID=174260 RepID=A0A9W9ZWT3_9CNID|nr:hypothetical protein OS493_032187 [Desmophyllum pertusum]
MLPSREPGGQDIHASNVTATTNHGGQRTCFAKNQYNLEIPASGVNQEAASAHGSIVTVWHAMTATSVHVETSVAVASAPPRLSTCNSDYNHQTVNPSNQCQWCDLYDAATRANSAWTNRPTVPCDDAKNCTKQDTCKLAVVQGWVTLVNHLTLHQVVSGLLSVWCNGLYGTCPGAVTDNIVLKTGSLQTMNSKFQSGSTYQSIIDRLFLKISGFSVSCGQIHLRWSVLPGTSTCSFNSPVSGNLKKHQCAPYSPWANASR